MDNMLRVIQVPSIKHNRMKCTMLHSIDKVLNPLNKEVFPDHKESIYLNNTEPNLLMYWVT